MIPIAGIRGGLLACFGAGPKCSNLRDVLAGVHVPIGAVGDCINWKRRISGQYADPATAKACNESPPRSTMTLPCTRVLRVKHTANKVETGNYQFQQQLKHLLGESHAQVAWVDRCLYQIAVFAFGQRVVSDQDIDYGLPSGDDLFVDSVIYEVVADNLCPSVRYHDLACPSESSNLLCCKCVAYKRMLAIDDSLGVQPDSIELLEFSGVRGSRRSHSNTLFHLQ